MFFLKAFGLNVDFAPVLDIKSNLKNPIIGDRSFGSNPTIVSNLGIQTMKGIQAQNIENLYEALIFKKGLHRSRILSESL